MQADMSGAERSEDRSLDQSAEDQQADGEMPHSALLQIIEEEDTSDEAIEQLKAFLTAYLKRMNEPGMVCMLQGSCHSQSPKGGS